VYSIEMKLILFTLVFAVSFTVFASDKQIAQIEALFKRGRTDDAKIAIGKYLTADDNSKSYLAIANLYARLKKWPDAVHYYEIVTQRDKKNARGWYQLGLAYHQSGKVDDAVASLRQSLNISPKTAKTYVALGEILELAHDRLDARNIYTTAIKYIGPKYEFVAKLCKLEQRDYFYEHAIRDCKKAIALNPYDSESMTILAKVLFEKNRRPEAMELLKKIINKFPKEPLAFRTRGMIYFNEKAYEAAANDLGQAFGLDPMDDEAGIHLGRALFELGMYDVALQTFIESIRLNRVYRFEITSKQREVERKGKSELAAKYQKALEEI